MNTLNKYFEHIYCINLDSRPDKWQECELEFARNDLQVERVSGVYGPDLPDHPVLHPWEHGCTQSHLNVLQQIADSSYKRVLVLEDDVEFDYPVNRNFSDRIAFVPDNWDMLYLGANHFAAPIPVNQWVVRATKAYTASSYAIGRDMAQNLLSAHTETSPLIDVFYAQLQPEYLCYAFAPVLAWQRPGYSDIRQENVDYLDMMMPNTLQGVYQQSSTFSLRQRKRLFGRRESHLVEKKRNQSIEMNITSILIWQLCNGVHSVQQIARLVADMYTTEPDSIQQDVVAAIKELYKVGAIIRIS